MPPYLVAGLVNYADAVNLSDGQSTFIPSEAMQAADNEQLPGMISFAPHPRGQYAAAVTQPTNTVSVQMSILITTNYVGQQSQTNAIELIWQSIEWKLEQARKAAAPSAVGTPIYFAHDQNGGASETTYYQIVDGTLQFVPLSVPFGAPWKGGVLTLYVRPYGFGRQVADTVSGTLTNGALASVISRLGVPGVVEAMTRLLITDVSTSSVYINRLRGSVKSSRPLPAGTWTPEYIWGATGAGVTHTDPTATGGSCARLASATNTFQTFAHVTSAAGANQNDTVDAWGVLRDSSTPLNSPTWPTTGALTAGTSGNLLDGQYIIVATTHDGGGNESTPIGAQYVDVPVTQTTFFDGAEGADFALWTDLGFTFTGGGTQGNIVIDTESSYPLDAPGNQYGFHANSAVNVYSGTGSDIGAGFAYLTIPGGGHTGSMRYRLKINSNTGTGENLIPLVLDSNNVPILCFYAGGGSGWFLSDAESSGPYSVEFGQGSWIASVEVQLTAYNAGTGAMTVTLIVNDTTVFSGRTFNQGSDGAPVRFAIGAYTSVDSTAGNNTALDVYFDDVQISASAIGSPIGSIVIDWLAPSMGAGTGTNLYIQRNGGSWMQVATTGTTYTLTSNTAGTVVPAGPPLGAPAMQAGLFRLLYGVNGALTPLTQIAPAISVPLSAQWQLVRLAQGIVLPPQPAQFGGSPPPWICQLQGASGGTNTPNLDAALLWLVPSGQDFVEITSGSGASLATLCQWQLDIDPSGYVSVELYDAATGLTLQQGGIASGQLQYGPSDTIASFIAEVSDGSGHYIVDMVNCKFTIQALLTPKYTTPTGAR